MEDQTVSYPPIPAIQDRSYGIIALRFLSSIASISTEPSIKPTAQNTQVLIIKQRTIHPSLPSYWTFPKGHPEYHDKSLKHTAMRELLEETGLSIFLNDFITSSSPKDGEEKAISFSEVYENPIRKVGKEVRYWVAVVKGEQEVRFQEKEVEEGRWCSFEEAKGLITFTEGRRILEDVGRCSGV
ncbi:NUDIX hydrolase domain-like protein [Halenospora varia]|nr:NUDIX hydrolase domain-like protein [Halenospora varia]